MTFHNPFWEGVVGTATYETKRESLWEIKTQEESINSSR
jgi:hypothetical protein